MYSSYYLVGNNLRRSFPSPPTLSLEQVGFATLLCVSTTLKAIRIDLACSCFHASNCAKQNEVVL